ncbi:MAG: hypothetical protein ABI811_17300 [Acidobacteriota bacterium]
MVTQATSVGAWARAAMWIGIALSISNAAAQSVRNPHGPVNIACENCHTVTSWAPLRAQPEFSHNQQTLFPLRGMHENITCNSCHVSKVFTEAPVECANCHADFHRGSFGAQCDSCHTVRGWKAEPQAVVGHQNRFPLLGAHGALACDSCHKSAATGVYVGLNTTCTSCHLPQFQQARTVNHVSAGFSQTCESCHNVNQWAGARFDHSTTRFPLTGKHTSASCATCHVGGQFKAQPTECISCHQPDFSQTSNPNHTQAGFPVTCESCHTTERWQGAQFNHTTFTKFALTGAHADVGCASCHVNGRFAGTPQACSGCHMPNFDAAKNPNHRASNFSTQCETCHTSVQWSGAKFDHSLARFPLTGKHTNVECATCHKGGQFTGTPSTCVNCHQAQFDATANPNHKEAGFPATCETCHTTTQWLGARFDHGTTKFPLTGKHSNASCSSCHVGGSFAGLNTACTTCHLPDYQKTTNPNHVALGFPQACESCHTTARWSGAKFDHTTSTKFPLTGKHTNASCSSCHLGGQFAGLGTACSTCHLPDFQKTTNPNHVAAAFPQTCESCHTTSQWSGAKFDHNTSTKFPLTGKHTNASCTSCHIGGKFTGLGTACSTCHLTDFQKTTNPNHVAASFPQTCESCHTTTQWTGARFDHNTSTKFPLTGKHTNASCTSCHLGGKFAGLETACSTCHLPDFQKTTNPNHVAASFPQTCESCHTTTQWNGAKFDHNTSTKFPLTGKHTATACASCHVGGKFAGLGTACSTCHMPDFQMTTNPNHVAAGFPQTCESCHTTIQWTGATFNHNSSTRFPLTGKHTTASCTSCHVGGKFGGLGTECATCHLAEFQKTTNPNHAAAGFSQNCSFCHTTSQWLGAQFDHAKTRFPLTGKHTASTCASCHVGGKFAGLGTACSACHLPDFQKTTNPNHAAAGFPQTCETCHTTTQWAGARFDHNTTKFPLTGKHISSTCASCHVGGKFTGLGTACATCHLPDFQKTTNPNHVAAGFPQSCETCHTTTRWAPATFNHNTSTKFPLTGKHTAAACASCHVGGKFSGLGTACSTCHLPDFQKTTNPNHAAAGFSQTCETCHTTTQWSGAAFNHNTTKFPLTGKHTAAACATCHVGGKFAGLGTACSTCHLPDFQKTTNPNHAAAGFPQTCETCHTTTQWTGAKFNHNATKFPLTGKHTAAACAICHVGGKFAGLGTACSTCHLPQYQAATNPSHAGFPQTCESCHTTTQWAGATFNHNATKFPLTGKHTSATCATCHVGGKFAGLGTACSTCHLPDFQKTTNPNHAAAGFPQTCESCHTTTQWTGATFNHSTTKFPLTGKHTSATCASCHVGGKFAGLGTACSTCHLPQYQAAKNPSHAGFPQTCESCHTTTQWTGATFNHNATRFPLTGKHTSVACATCHVGGEYAGLGTACSTCHLPDFQKTTNPNHGAAGFPQTCESCHTTTQWTGATFNHNTTRFPLTGKHTSVTCATCHVGGKFAGLGTACSTCHLPQYQAARNPSHAGLPQTCETCHTTTQWTPATFNHGTTRFPLTGKHTSVTCASCHVGGKFAGLGTACATCHLPAYQATTNPNHAAAGFPQDCSLCHSTTNWSGATFDHATTRFPLTGKHTTVACATCHVNNQYATLPTTCVSCHLAKFQATTSPNHVTAGFPQTCETCHSTTQWTGATFNHATTAFPLTGKHTTVACASCHVNGVYKGTPKDCYSCHAAVYTRTTNPNHAAAGFPPTCASCHTTSQWTGATFTHGAFPITTGAHKKGTWNTCADCHPNASNFSVFSCTTGCHPASQTNNKHNGVRNYVYNSANCYSCHPQGKN